MNTYMKKRVLLWITTLIFTTTLMAQEVPAGVVEAFKKGNSKELAGYLSSKVDMVLQNKTKPMNKAEAEATMRTFFAQNPVTGFTVNHKSKRSDSSFFVGTLATKEGNYRINCFFKRIQNKYLIHQIRIDKANE